MKMTYDSNSQQGFTLLELLVAITLFTIGLLAVAQMQNVAINANTIANRTTLATSLAQQVMEDIMSRSTKTGNVFPSAGAPNILLQPYNLNPVNNPFTVVPNMTISFPDAGTFSAQYSIVRGPTPDIPANMGLITVTVSVTNRVAPVTLTSLKRLQ